MLMSPFAGPKTGRRTTQIWFQIGVAMPVDVLSLLLSDLLIDLGEHTLVIALGRELEGVVLGHIGHLLVVGGVQVALGLLLHLGHNVHVQRLGEDVRFGQNNGARRTPGGYGKGILPDLLSFIPIGISF